MSGAPPPGGLGGATPPAGPVGYYTPPAELASRPAIIFWYRVYAIVSALVYVAMVLAWSSVDAGQSTGRLILQASLYATPFVLFYGVAALVPFKPWGWSYGLIAIAFGMISCLAPFSIVLVILWSRPQVKAAFQRL